MTLTSDEEIFCYRAIYDGILDIRGYHWTEVISYSANSLANLFAK